MPPTDLPAEEMDKVKLRNNSRRSLMVTVPGQALHVQPGGTIEVPRAFLTTDVLAALLRTGAVVPIVSPPAAAVPVTTRRVEAISDVPSTPPVLAGPSETGLPRGSRRPR